MILVDTSVWIDYLRGRSTTAVDTLEDVLDQRTPFGISAAIYQEILQGAESESDFERLRQHFGTQRFYHPLDPVESHAEAARIYARCRRAGVTVRSTLDCLIAQVAIEHQLHLLHDDRDYVAIARVVPELKLLAG